MNPDDLDRQILVELQQDGRRPFREIGRRLGASERTIRSRVKRLQDEGALRILAFIDPHALGTHVLAALIIRVEASRRDGVVDALVSWSEVSYVSSLLGEADVYAQVICRDNDELWKLVATRLRVLAGVTDVQVFLEMAVHKFSYAYPSSS